MRKTRMGKVFAVLVTIGLSLASCNLFAGEGKVDEIAQTYVVQTEQAQGAAQTAVAQTLAAEGDREPAVEDAPKPEGESDEGPHPTMTSTVGQTPTPQAPQVHVDQDTNCRTGPGRPYQRLGGLLVGEDAEVVGRWPGGDYWIIQNPDGNQECWLWGRYATLEGPTEDLPAYTQPPTPTPTFTLTPTLTPTAEVDWSGTWDTRWESGGVYGTSDINVSQSGNTVTGSYTFGGSNYSMNGTLSADRMTWSGTTEAGGGAISYSFVWHRVSDTQFSGSLDGSRAWCGFRAGSGAGYPSPCMGP